MRLQCFYINVHINTKGVKTMTLDINKTNQNHQVRGMDQKQAKMYLVKAGDTLTSIAKRFGVSVKDILKVNPDIKDANKIMAGEVIRMPAKAELNPNHINIFDTVDKNNPKLNMALQLNMTTKENPGFKN